MDDIAKRLDEAAKNCIKHYESWLKDKKDGKTREEMMEAVHELRKVAARLEIDMAISERDEMTSKPIPIPPHRASRKRNQDGGGNDGGQASRPSGKKPAGNKPAGRKKTGTEDSQ